MALMRAKFQVLSVEKFEGGTERVKFVAVSKSTPYGPDGDDEDNTYAKWSPAAECVISIANPVLWGKLQPGKKFYVDFTEAP